MRADNRLSKSLEEAFINNDTQYNFGGWVPYNSINPPPSPSPTPTPTITATQTSTPTPTPTITPSQTPPIPVGNMIYRFDASSSSNVVLRSSGGVDYVETWYDTSGNNNHINQTDTSKQPIYEPDGFGSYQVKFDGVDDFLFITGITNIATGITAYTEFMVFEVDSYVAEFRIDATDGESDSYYLQSADRFTPLYYPGAYFDPMSSWSLQPNFLVWSRKGITSGSMVGEMNDLSHTGALFDSWTPDDLTRIYIGVADGGVGSAFPGKLREVIVYRTLLSDIDTANIYSYLKTKWNYSAW